MTTETIETTAAPPAEEANLASTEETQTESHEAAVASESEAVASEAAQVEVTPPSTLTREEVQRMIDEREARIREDERLKEQGRRRTENARKAKLEQDEREAAQEAADTLRAALGAKGIYELPDDTVMTAISRLTTKGQERAVNAAIGNTVADVETTLRFLLANGTGEKVEPLDESLAPLSVRFRPLFQDFVDGVYPAIAEKAVEEFKKNEFSKAVDAEIARRAAASRKGQEDLTRVEGKTPDTIDRSIMAVANRIINNTADDEDRRIFRASGYSPRR